MNAQTQKVLIGIAKCAGLTLEFPVDAPARISGFQDINLPDFTFDANQPDSELIFDILKAITPVSVQNNEIQHYFSWFLNRAYEYELASCEITSTARDCGDMQAVVAFGADFVWFIPSFAAFIPFAVTRI